MTDENHSDDRPDHGNNRDPTELGVNNIQNKNRKGSRERTNSQNKRKPSPKPATIRQRWKKSTITNKIIAIGTILAALAAVVYATVEVIKFIYPSVDPAERALIVIKRIDGQCDESANQFVTKITFVNSGKTQALNVRGVSGILFDVRGKDEDIPYPNEGDAKAKGILGPGDTMSMYPGTQGYRFDPSFYDFCASAKTKRTLINGKIWYSDIHACQHWIGFKLLYMPLEGGFSPVAEDVDGETCNH